MDEADKRTQPRAQYFLIKDEHEAVPIYAFREQDDVKAIPALVVDISEGGVQILTTHTASVSQQAYQLEVVTASPTTSAMERAHIEKVWSREDGVNVRTGFAFDPGSSIGAEWNAILQQAPHHLLRCVLHPVP
jgi:hypothetical protein